MCPHIDAVSLFVLAEVVQLNGQMLGSWANVMNTKFMMEFTNSHSKSCELPLHLPCFSPVLPICEMQLF